MRTATRCLILALVFAAGGLVLRCALPVIPVDAGFRAVLRAYAAQYATMEGANDLARLAIRTCGGQAMLKSLPLERIYRDSRCGSLMLPWTAELCLDRIGRESLYEAGETDE